MREYYEILAALRFAKFFEVYLLAARPLADCQQIHFKLSPPLAAVSEEDTF